MGRPHSFNKNEALFKAMNLFWLKGYKSTSVDDLLKAMSINKSSFYNDFQSKLNIFLLSIECYRDNLVKSLIEIVREGHDPDLNIYNLFKYFIDKMLKEGDMRGCLLGNSINEISIHDKKINQEIVLALEKLLIAISDKITNGKDGGIFKNKNTSSDLANFVLASLQGVLMLGKIGANKEVLEKNATMTLEFLKG